ncbi:hypothetical protein, partial [Burkholderia cenocepacia]|uniref:hypothetical protein n=1 Tax=Burkholderia cenocepacia TaxID=95486 RepID=UPI001C0D475F
ELHKPVSLVVLRQRGRVRYPFFCPAVLDCFAENLVLHGLYMDASGLPRFVALSNRYRLRFYIRPMQVEARWPQWNPLTHASFLPRTVMLSNAFEI